MISVLPGLSVAAILSGVMGARVYKSGKVPVFQSFQIVSRKLAKLIIAYAFLSYYYGYM
jgi:hypothetical protein